MLKTIDLSIIIVSYNCKEYLKNCLRSVLKEVLKLSHEVIVVDNASTDATVEMLKKEFPYIILINNSINVGFSKANNQAVRQSKGKYILLLNPDTIVLGGAIERVVDFMENTKDSGAVGCKILNPDGSIQLGCVRSFPTISTKLFEQFYLWKLFSKSKLFGKHLMTYFNYKEVIEVDMLSGSFMLLRAKTLNEVGLFDENSFLYCDDIDICYRIKKAGWKIFYIPYAEIIHYGGRSTSQAMVKTLYESYKANDYFFTKHNSRVFLVITRLFVFIGSFLRLWVWIFITIFISAKRHEAKNRIQVYSKVLLKLTKSIISGRIWYKAPVFD